MGKGWVAFMLLNMHSSQPAGMTVTSSTGRRSNACTVKADGGIEPLCQESHPPTNRWSQLLLQLGHDRTQHLQLLCVYDLAQLEGVRD